MHDPVTQTGARLRSVVQGYFNYYAVPGNLDSLGLFRERVLRYWGQALKRRSQRHRYTWVRRLKLGASVVDSSQWPRRGHRDVLFSMDEADLRVVDQGRL
jgi:hypothetical protein